MCLVVRHSSVEEWTTSEGWKEKAEAGLVGKVARVQTLMELLSHVKYLGFYSKYIDWGLGGGRTTAFSMNSLTHF